MLFLCYYSNYFLKGENFMEKEILEIVNQVKPDWSKDLIIRFLYIKLAPCFRRDLQYFLATEEEKYNQFSQGFINRFPTYS